MSIGWSNINSDWQFVVLTHPFKENIPFGLAEAKLGLAFNNTLPKFRTQNSRGWKRSTFTWHFLKLN